MAIYVTNTERKRPRGTNARAGVLGVLLLSLFLTFSANAQTIVVNTTVPPTAISKTAVQAIFGMRMRTWPDDTPITVYVLKTSDPLHADFCKNVLGVFPHQLRRAWDRLVFSGTGQAPREVSSLNEMRERVAMTPGAIGYLPQDDVDDTLYKLEVR